MPVCRCGCVAVSQVVAGVSVRQLTHSMSNVLHTAAATVFDGRFLEMLFECDPACAAVMNDLDDSGRSPLVVAVQAANVDTVRVLLRYGVKLVTEAVRCFCLLMAPHLCVVFSNGNVMSRIASCGARSLPCTPCGLHRLSVTRGVVDKPRR